MYQLLTLVFIAIFPTLTFAYSELSFEYGYDRQLYGENRSSKNTVTTYAGTWAFYFLENTAVEFNYTSSDNVTKSKMDLSITGSGYSIVGTKTLVETDVYGIGLRQALAKKGSRLRPMIALGYAKQFVRSGTEYNIKNDSTSAESVVTDPTVKARSDTAFGSFILQLALTQRFSLKASVKSIVEAKHLGNYNDDVKYTVGFSMIL